MQRLLILLVIGSLAAAAWLIAKQQPAPEEGLVVHVYLEDQAGKPVAPAQIIQVFDEKRNMVNGDGYARLTGVTLRADEAPSAEALTVALRPLSLSHAMRRGFDPTVTQRDDGSWEVRYPLHGHGILRIHVEAAGLGPCKAFLERDHPLQRWEPVGAHQVVRAGSVVDFRIYGGWDKVPVLLEGLPDREGTVAVATQRFLVDVPPPGHTAQLRIMPERVDPIAGVIRMAEGREVPTLRGRMHIRQVREDGTLVDLGSVPVDEDGGFVAAHVGPGTFELEARMAAVPGGHTQRTEGGEYLEWELERPPQWLVVKHPDLKADGRPRQWSLQATGTRSVAPLQSARVLRTSDDETLLMLPANEANTTGGTPGVLVVLDIPGSPTAPPRRGTADVDLAPIGATTTTIAVEAVESATVVVEMDLATWGPARSARIEVGGRARTLVKGAKKPVVIKHVATDPDPRTEGQEPTWLTVTWDDEDAAQFVQPLRLDPSEPTTIAVARSDGGFFALRGEAGVPSPEHDLYVFVAAPEAWPDEIAANARVVHLRRSDARPLWTSAHALPVGRYEAVLGFDRGPGAPSNFWTRPATTYAFEIKAGATTVVDLKQP